MRFLTKPFRPAAAYGFPMGLPYERIIAPMGLQGEIGRHTWAATVLRAEGVPQKQSTRVARVHNCGFSVTDIVVSRLIMRSLTRRDENGGDFSADCHRFAAYT
ncbi:hypothetical protein SBA3_1300016 [Candidatus Sulfopaludibacter sp. SbA3]|nr:hypothetical protein SBA3_1300016 [Candidatus Sulfopaludibacter sp. SbA3]